ncbi:BQ2448_801 [Microbotryum intermedium]|uniref:BQ2448_801 protein n=1 Tax=Microbotryum intermedium TaxID=269621 RepID=A0A238F3E1_9BASI|nr:BQ2448_801 [Microbotryum intermedium]
MSSGTHPPTSSSSSPGTNVFGSLPKAGFLRRGSNKKTPAPAPVLALKTPTPPLHQAESEPIANSSHRFDTHKNPIPTSTLTSTMTTSTSRTNENEDPLYGPNPPASIAHSNSSGSLAPFGDSRAVSVGSSSIALVEHDLTRRGSVVSNASSSLQPNSGLTQAFGPGGGSSTSGAHFRNPNRNSLSSFASSSGGSPRGTASLFSNSTTIGDLSTASMPLLPQGGAPPPSHSSQTANSSATGSQMSFAGRRDSLSATSDSSSVHSYPPRPRTGASSESDQGRSSFGQWPSTNSTDLGPSDRIRHTSSSDTWSNGFSFYNSVVGRRGSANSLGTGSNYGGYGLTSTGVPGASPSSKIHSPHSIINYALSSNRAATSSSPQSSYINPLAPLRKRLARALAFPRRGNGFEVQLVLELIDALEHCVEEGSRRRRLSLPTLNHAGIETEIAPHKLVRADPDDFEHVEQEGGGADTPTAGTTTTAPAPSTSLEALFEEVQVLIKELVEIASDARKCLVAGRYGPLSLLPAGVTTSSSASKPSKLDPSALANALIDPGTLDWWPRRLSRDLRALLDDVGFAAVLRRRRQGGGRGVGENGTASATLASSRLSFRGRSAFGFDDLRESGEEDWETDESLNQALTVVVESLQNRQDGASVVGSKNGAWEGENGAKIPGRIGLGVVMLEVGLAGEDVERKEKLLVEGQRRWDSWKKSQEAD